MVAEPKSGSQPPPLVPRDDKPTKSVGKSGGTKKAQVDDDGDPSEPEASPLDRPGKRPARCVGILQDYGLGTPLSDDDQQFLRNKCK
jgi:hypothetical protein